MSDLPLLTKSSRKVLKCCIKDLQDMRRYECELRPHMLYAYLHENASKPMSKVEIDDCVLYLEDVELICDIERDVNGKISSFRLNHKGFYYFALEKMLKSHQRITVMCESFLLPVIVSVITTLLTILLTM